MAQGSQRAGIASVGWGSNRARISPRKLRLKNLNPHEVVGGQCLGRPLLACRGCHCSTGVWGQVTARAFKTRRWRLPRTGLTRRRQGRQIRPNGPRTSAVRRANAERARLWPKDQHRSGIHVQKESNRAMNAASRCRKVS